MAVALSPTQFFFYMLLTIPSYLLYWMVFYVLVRPAHKAMYRTSFFKLTILIAVTDLTMFVVFNLEYRFLLFPPLAVNYKDLSPQSFFLKFVFFGAYFLRYFKGCLVFSTSLNQMTAVYFPEKQEKIWKHLINVCVGCSLILALSLTWYYFWCDINVIAMDSSNTTYGLSPQLAWFKPASALKLSLFGVVCGSCDLIVNMITCITLFCYCYKSVQFNKAFLSLTLITVVEFVIQLMTFFAEGGIYLCMEDANFGEWFFTWYFAMVWITDLSTLVKPYSLLLISRSTRSAFLETYECFRPGHRGRITAINQDIVPKAD